MEKYWKLIFVLWALLQSCHVHQISRDRQVISETAILHNGVPWFDNRGKIVNAHSVCVLEENGKYYLFGEYKTDSANRFIGISCYSSSDLVNWTFERIALPLQREGLLGPDRIGERVKVMKSPMTGDYVMYMHTDNMKYTDPYIGVATSKTINGEYEFKGPLFYEGNPIKKWDMGTFQDVDGKGYLLIHHGDIYRLSDDYLSAEEKVTSSIPGVGESPAMFQKNGIYYLLSSNLTSWERNDNKYHTAPSIAGPWTAQGLFCPEGSLTHNSQCSFVFPLVRGNDTIPIYMGDRWSFPKQADAATQVWQPFVADGTALSIPVYWSSWDVKSLEPVSFFPNDYRVLDPVETLCSNKRGDDIAIHFDGAPIGLIGRSVPNGGYAHVCVIDKAGRTVHASYVDFYSKVPNTGLRFVTPKLPRGTYTLKVEVSGEHGVWFNKRGDRFGSNDYWVCVEKILLLSDAHINR